MPYKGESLIILRRGIPYKGESLIILLRGIPDKGKSLNALSVLPTARASDQSRGAIATSGRRHADRTTKGSWLQGNGYVTDGVRVVGWVKTKML